MINFQDDRVLVSILYLVNVIKNSRSERILGTLLFSRALRFKFQVPTVKVHFSLIIFCILKHIITEEGKTLSLQSLLIKMIS